jgi:hypothetical protein
VELLSGPDLGGGFLFQLQAERVDGRALVTFHAQEGGLEAAVPAKGPLTDLGFEQYPGACGFGGRECFHRGFDVPVGELGRVRMTYNRTRFVVGPSLEQRYGALVPPVREALAEVAGRLHATFGGGGSGWFVGGSAGALLQGLDVAPRDIDLGTDHAGVERIAEALAEFLIEPPSRTSWPPRRPVYAARAFVGTLVNGVRVQWAVPDGAAGAPPPYTEWARAAAEVPLETAQVGGHSVPVARLEFFVARQAARHDPARLRDAAQCLAALGPDERLVGELITQLPAADGRRMREAVDAARRSRVEA